MQTKKVTVTVSNIQYFSTILEVPIDTVIDQSYIDNMPNYEVFDSISDDYFELDSVAEIKEPE